MLAAAELKASRYNVLVRGAEGTAVAYNTLYGSLTQLDPEDVAEVGRALEAPGDARAEVLTLLTRQRHLVPGGTDELAILRSRKSAGVSDRKRLDVIVLTTLDCNLGCVYCYETRRPGTLLGGDAENALYAYLERELPGTRLLMLHWFGGEPLMNARLIARAGARVRSIAASTGTDVAMSVTTNGYLLSGQRRQDLLDAGVTDFQVTLDGPADTHDRLRPTLGGRASFRRIFTNVVETVRAAPHVGMTVRVNVNHLNLDRVPELLRAFDPDVRARLRLALEPIFGDHDVSATENLTASHLARALADLYQEAEGLGFQVASRRAEPLTGRLTYCYAERERQVVIGPDGSVFKCTAGSFALADRLATLMPDGTVSSADGRWERWMSIGDTFAEPCEACVYLPLCMGGCRKMQWNAGPAACTLVPANADYVLKQIALVGLSGLDAIDDRIPAHPEK